MDRLRVGCVRLQGHNAPSSPIRPSEMPSMVVQGASSKAFCFNSGSSIGHGSHSAAIPPRAAVCPALGLGDTPSVGGGMSQNVNVTGPGTLSRLHSSGLQ